MTTVPQGHDAGNRPAGNRLVANRLVIVAPNWLGDAVMALPAIAAVINARDARDARRARPDLEITVAARSSIAPLFTMVPGVSRVIDVAGPDLRGRSFDTALLLPNAFRAAWLAWRAGIPERWGYATQGRSLLLTRGIAVGEAVHQAAYYQRLTAALGFPEQAAPPELHVSPDLAQSGVARLTDAGWDPARPLVAMAPGAVNGRAKQWPTESYAAVARELAAEGVATVLVGAPADARAGSEIMAALRKTSSGSTAADGAPPQVLDLIGRTDLRGLAAVLVNCRALVCNDSGAMHVAAALGVPITAMFGPSRERETRPIGRSAATVLTHHVWCRPCMLRDCPLDHGCMRGITVDRVVSATRGLMEVRS